MNVTYKAIEYKCAKPVNVRCGTENKQYSMLTCKHILYGVHITCFKLYDCYKNLYDSYTTSMKTNATQIPYSVKNIPQEGFWP